MLNDRQNRLQDLATSIESDLDASNATGDVKIGDTTRFFYVASDHLLAGKAGRVGFAFTPEGTLITPGKVLSFAIDKSRVDFEGPDGQETFNPLAGKLSSDATTPYPVFIPKLVNDDLRELIGMVGLLSDLAGGL